MSMFRAAFLDRDGVINRKMPEGQYVTRWEEMLFLPGAAEAICLLHRAGFRVIVASNQRCLAKGLLTVEELESIHRRMCEKLAADGATIDAVYYCPHDSQPRCACRKPAPGLLLEAAREHQIDLAGSWMIGDSDSDVAAGRNAGCKTARVSRRVEKAGEAADVVAPSLLDAVRQIVQLENPMADRGTPDMAQGKLRKRTTADGMHHHVPYVLITPARNEEALIEKVILSVIGQTALPLKWVIVNDGSTDATASIVGRYLGKYDWMELVDLPTHRDRSFAAKVYAFNAGFERIRDLEYEVVGNLDSDISFDRDYVEFLLEKFEDDASLGVAGTIFRQDGYSSATDSFEGQNHVAGGCQLFRRRCFEEIGGYIANRAGGIDWIAVTTARMMGWRTCSFREKSFFHYRSLGTAERSPLASAFSYGEKDYYLGNHPLWEIFRVLYRAAKKPYLLEGIALYSGYLSAFLRRMKRPVSDDLMRFHRKEQMLKLRAIFRSLLKLERIDSFKVKLT